jgi:phosphoserine phosphatase RsbU/P
MSVKLLSRNNPSASQLQILERMNRSTNRANRMVNDLLDFTQARIGRGLACTPKEIDAHALISETVEELTSAYPGRQVRHLKEGESLSFVDPDRLAQLVVNLVSNAMAYGDPLQAVTVSSTSTRAYLEVRVHNYGSPIQSNALERIFHPLVRGDVQESTSRSVGLGLYIVSEIAKGHGGRVHVVSEAEVGTTFVAFFPRSSSDLSV